MINLPTYHVSRFHPSGPEAGWDALACVTAPDMDMALHKTNDTQKRAKKLGEYGPSSEAFDLKWFRAYAGRKDEVNA